MQQAATGLAGILGELLRHAPSDEAVRLAWPLVCGASVAGRTRPVALTEGNLQIAVPDQTWVTQLSELAPRYVTEFKQVLGKNTVRHIRFIVES